jgi:Bacterial TniB protein.
MWLGYPKAWEVHDRLEDLLAMPQLPRARCLLIWGTTNNGKTMLVKEFVRRHPPAMTPENDGVIMPVLNIEAPAKADERRFWGNILAALGAIFRPSAPIATLEQQALQLLRDCHVRMLMIDEIHNILTGRRDAQHHFLVTIKDLSNKLDMSLVAIGTEQARAALMSDPQLRTRFRTLHLPKWNMDNEFRSLLASFERMIPLPEPSRLSSTAMASLIYSKSSGLLGEVADLLYQTAQYATAHGHECITVETIQAVGFQTLSERDRCFSDY